MAPTPTRPRSPSADEQARPIFLYFEDVSEEDVLKISAASTKLEVKGLLKACMKIDQAEGHRMEILADMHYHNYAFCAARDFTPKKTSTFLSVMKLVLADAVSRRLTVDDAFDVFKAWLLKHSVQRPPKSVGIFTFEDVRAIMDYVHGSFFRHYRLYMYVFMTECSMSFFVDDFCCGVVPPPLRPPLLRADEEVDPRSQPELSHIFRPSEAELVEAEMKRIRERDAPPEEKRAALIQQRVDAGMKALLEKFEGKLKDQDERFHSMIDTA